MDHVWIMHMDDVWLMYGSCIDYVWMVHGLCMDYAWAMWMRRSLFRKFLISWTADSNILIITWALCGAETIVLQ